jgi:hypothetical protein
MRVGCHFRIDVLSHAEDRYSGVRRATPEHAEQTDLYRGVTDPHFEILDGLIEAGGCPDRSGLRGYSVVLVKKVTQEVPTSDRVVDG